MVKQIIIVRKDINMRKGKIAAQVSHASLKVFLDRSDWENDHTLRINNIDENMREWLKTSFTKIVVGVDSEEELYELADKAKRKNLPFSIIVDNGFTEFHGNKTTTCIAIGPADSEDIDEITGHLKLL